MKGSLVKDTTSSLGVSSTTALVHPTTVRMRNSHALSIIPRLSGSNTRPDSAAMPRRVPWRFVVVAVMFLILIGWGLAPGDRRRRLLETVSSYPRPSPPTHFEFDEISDTPPHAKPPSPRPASQGASHDVDKPLTFETDPDKSKTVHCTTPYKPDSPLVQWALMVDAGSTGSRIHVYKFNNCRKAPTYEYEVFHTTRPGLSKFPGDPAAAARSLDTLLDVARTTVPENMQRCTPIAVKATAGLRLLGTEQSTTILNAIRARLKSQYPFRLIEKDGVVIMDGSDEGVYAWITANYLLGTIAPETPSYAVLDLGGASTQIVFEPKFVDPKTNSLPEGDHKFLLNFGGHSYLLYQHSYLGYGLMHARERIHRLVDFLHSDPGAEIPNPCLARGTERAVNISESKHTVKMIGADIGAFDACSRVVDLVLAKDALCPMKPCSFAGVYQPPLHDVFPHGKVLLLSYFYDRLAPLLPSGNDALSLGTLGALAARVCGGKPAWNDGVGAGNALHSAGFGKAEFAGAPWTEADAAWAWSIPWDEAAQKELLDRPEHCLDLTFMHALLRGYGLGSARKVNIAKKVEDTELGWCLGATIVMLEGVGMECIG